MVSQSWTGISLCRKDGPVCILSPFKGKCLARSIMFPHSQEAPSSEAELQILSSVPFTVPFLHSTNSERSELRAADYGSELISNNRFGLLTACKLLYSLFGCKWQKCGVVMLTAHVHCWKIDQLICLSCKPPMQSSWFMLRESLPVSSMAKLRTA